MFRQIFIAHTVDSTIDLRQEINLEGLLLRFLQLFLFVFSPNFDFLDIFRKRKKSKTFLRSIKYSYLMATVTATRTILYNLFYQMALQFMAQKIKMMTKDVATVLQRMH